jgi:hypothetical protein
MNAGSSLADEGDFKTRVARWYSWLSLQPSMIADAPYLKIAESFALKPLPAHWRYVDGVFMHMLTGNTQDEHPLLDKARAELTDSRSKNMGSTISSLNSLQDATNTDLSSADDMSENTTMVKVIRPREFGTPARDVEKPKEKEPVKEPVREPVKEPVRDVTKDKPKPRDFAKEFGMPTKRDEEKMIPVVDESDEFSVMDIQNVSTVSDGFGDDALFLPDDSNKPKPAAASQASVPASSSTASSSSAVPTLTVSTSGSASTAKPSVSSPGRTQTPASAPASAGSGASFYTPASSTAPASTSAAQFDAAPVSNTSESAGGYEFGISGTSGRRRGRAQSFLPVPTFLQDTTYNSSTSPTNVAAASSTTSAGTTTRPQSQSQYQEQPSQVQTRPRSSSTSPPSSIASSGSGPSFSSSQPARNVTGDSSITSSPIASTSTTSQAPPVAAVPASTSSSSAWDDDYLSSNVTASPISRPHRGSLDSRQDVSKSPSNPPATAAASRTTTRESRTALFLDDDASAAKPSSPVTSRSQPVTQAPPPVAAPPVVVEKIVEKVVTVEKIVEVEKPVYVEKIVERVVEVVKPPPPSRDLGTETTPTPQSSMGINTDDSKQLLRNIGTQYDDHAYYLVHAGVQCMLEPSVIEREVSVVVEREKIVHVSHPGDAAKIAALEGDVAHKALVVAAAEAHNDALKTQLRELRESYDSLLRENEVLRRERENGAREREQAKREMKRAEEERVQMIRDRVTWLRGSASGNSQSNFTTNNNNNTNLLSNAQFSSNYNHGSSLGSAKENVPLHSAYPTSDSAAGLHVALGLTPATSSRGSSMGLEDQTAFLKMLRLGRTFLDNNANQYSTSTASGSGSGADSTASDSNSNSNNSGVLTPSRKRRTWGLTSVADLPSGESFL